VLDAAIIACAQKNEHYEICAYGTLIAWAERLGFKDVIAILDQNLAEEKAADRALTDVAENAVNQKAETAEGNRAFLK